MAAVLCKVHLSSQYQVWSDLRNEDWYLMQERQSGWLHYICKNNLVCKFFQTGHTLVLVEIHVGDFP